MKHDYIVYTDGGCTVNPGGKGACACIISKGRKKESEYVEAYAATTNNRMEIMAVRLALSHIPTGSSVLLKSDSEYVIKTLSGRYSKEKNVDLWRALDKVMEGKTVDLKWVPGHSGIKNNELCDSLCTEAMTKGPWLDDLGFDGVPAKTEKKGSMGVEINVPENFPLNMEYSSAAEISEDHEVNIKCAGSIYNFYKTGKRRFKDYKEVKVFGTDIWSMAPKEDILNEYPEAAVVFNEALKHMEYKRAMSAMKWYARGLSFEDAIRHELVNIEIEQNMRR